MIISHQHKFVFIEIPHTGSHSISHELTELYGGEAIIRKHANVSQFIRQSAREAKGYFKFATVRNPLDYMVTTYQKLKNNHKGQYTNEKALLVNGGHVTSHHLRQFDFVYNKNGSFQDYLERFYDAIYNNWFLVGSHHFDYVMKFEDLQREFSHVLKLIGLAQTRPLPHINPTKDKKDYKEYYDEELKEIVLRNFGPFMQKWGYSLPNDWSWDEIPLASKLRFNTLDRLVGSVSSLVELNPDAPLVKKVKKVADLVT